MIKYKIRYTPAAMRDMVQSILKSIKHSIVYMTVI